MIKYVNLLYTSILILCLFLSCSDDKIIYKSYGPHKNPKLQEIGLVGKAINIKDYKTFKEFLYDVRELPCKTSVHPYIFFKDENTHYGIYPEVIFDCYSPPTFHYNSESTVYIDSSSIWLHDRFLKPEELESVLRKTYKEIKANPKGIYGNSVVFVFRRFPHEDLEGLQEDLESIVHLYDKIDPKVSLIVTFYKKYPIRMPQPKIDTNEFSF